MDISIIIVNYNTKKQTTECVKSCLNEASNLKIEIIVIDNASSDGSYELFKKEYKSNNNVVLLKNSKNFGFSKGVNKGLLKSIGKYKYLLNSDTKIQKYTLKKLIDTANKDNSIGIIGTKLILPDNSVQKSCYNLPTIKNAFFEFILGQKNKFSGYVPDGELQTEVEAVVGASFFITPKAYEKVRLFDEKYFMYFEDLDYCRRLVKYGLKIIYNPDIIVFHYHGLSGNKMADGNNQWRRLVPSSKIYHGSVRHNIINCIIWVGQKTRSILNYYEK